jgi:hypothetical protein
MRGCRVGASFATNRIAVVFPVWGLPGPRGKEFVLNVVRSRMVILSALLVGAVAAFAACAPLGMTLPVDPADTYPVPEGSRIKPTLGWLTTVPGETVGGAPEGSIAIQVLRQKGRMLLQQVRHYNVAEAAYGDSILLDRKTLRPVETYRWTPAGTYITKYNHRVIERTFQAISGSSHRSVETLDVEPYSALGLELLVASLPLSEGYVGLLPVAVDTAVRGWAWAKITVHSEQSMQERRDQRSFDAWIVDVDNGPGLGGLERTRMYIAIDGRSVRKIQHINADNEVLSTLRRMLLSVPSSATQSAAKPGSLQ